MQSTIPEPAIIDVDENKDNHIPFVQNNPLDKPISAILAPKPAVLTACTISKPKRVPINLLSFFPSLTHKEKATAQSKSAENVRQNAMRDERKCGGLQKQKEEEVERKKSKC